MKRFNLSAVVLAVLILYGTAWGAPIQWSENGHWYEAVSVGGYGISWTAANTAAQNAGGYLAALTSEAENAFVFDLISGDDYLNYWVPASFGGSNLTSGPYLGGRFLGATDNNFPVYLNDSYYENPRYDPVRGGSDYWRWVTNETWSYTNWRISEPSGFEGEFYLQFYIPYSVDNQNPLLPTWNDVEDMPPGGEVIAYIVEWDANPVPIPSAAYLLGAGLIGLVGIRRSFKN